MPDKDINTLTALVFVARLPAPVQLQKLREASIKFCEETEVWTEEQDIVTLAARDQPIASPHVGGYIYRIVMITEVRDKGTDVEQEIVLNRHTYQADNAHTKIEFDQVLEAGKDYRVYYILVPILLHSILPDWLIDRWGQAIADGAISMIRIDIGNLQDPNPWADPNQAAVYKQKFLEGIGRARQQIVSDNEGDDTLVEIPVY